MPYDIRKQGDNWVTYNKDSGDVKGKHKSRAKAVAQMRLLYGVEGGMKVRGK